MSPNKLLSEKEVEAHYGITVSFLRDDRYGRHGDKGRIPVVNVGRLVRYRVRDIEKYLERNSS